MTFLEIPRRDVREKPTGNTLKVAGADHKQKGIQNGGR